MPQFHQFDDQAVQAALDAAKQDYSEGNVQSLAGGQTVPTSGERSLLAECVNVTIEDNKVCVDLPLGFGQHCIPIPVTVPNGQAASACLTLCTTWGVPHGVRVSVIVAGMTIVSQVFGIC